MTDHPPDKLPSAPEKSLRDFIREATREAAGKGGLAAGLTEPMAPEVAARVLAIADPSERARELLRTVRDPEMRVNIYDLGLIYTLEADEARVYAEMTLTSPCCPVAELMPEAARVRLTEGFPAPAVVEVKLVWRPAWTKDRMTDEARLALDMW